MRLQLDGRSFQPRNQKPRQVKISPETKSRSLINRNSQKRKPVYQNQRKNPNRLHKQGHGDDGEGSSGSFFTRIHRKRG
jgi:hypothetical protein